jgi:arylsulfatase A
MLKNLSVVFCFIFCASRGVATEKPNIILIMADDVGIEGLGCYGGASYKTPNLDQMAAEGIRFTHAYSQPLCTPTRVQLMTGKYNHRNWRSFGVLNPNDKTFGHYMQAAGYVTGMFGKWQLQSYDPPDFPGASKRRGTGMHPKNAGFNEYALFHALHTEDKGSRYANPRMLEGVAGSDGILKTYNGKYGEDVWVEKILDFFVRHRDQPRFVYYPMALPHSPFEPTPNSAGWDPSLPQKTDIRFIVDMIEYMDTAVGNLMQGLLKKGLRQNTVVIFYSDNGNHVKVLSKMKDGRRIQGGKASTRQTGIHVPLIAHWPEHFSPSVCSDIIDASDFLPTLLELAGAPMSKKSQYDGISFGSRLLGRDGPRRETAFFWYDPRPGWGKERYTRHVFALNKNYKLFRTGRLLRLTDVPLQEILVDPLNMTDKDRRARQQLGKVIEEQMSGVNEPPLVNVYGEPEI